MGAKPPVWWLIDRLAPPVLELITEVVEAVAESKSKRDAARRVITVAAKRVLTG